MMLWNQLFSVLGSNLSESNTCNLNNNYLSSLAMVLQWVAGMGVNLTINCQGGTVQSNGQNIQPVVNTNFTPSIACYPNSNTGIYSDLTVTKAGYIICGTSAPDWNATHQQYPNYVIAYGNINAIIQNQTPQPNIAPSQYSIVYIFAPIPYYANGVMSVTLPGFNNGVSGLTFNTFGDYGQVTSGVLDYNPDEGSFIGQVQGDEIPMYWDETEFSSSIYYDNYHVLMINAGCPSNGLGSNSDGNYTLGCGIALACIPGYLIVLVRSRWVIIRKFNLDMMNLSTARTSDRINFANGDTLTMQISDVGQPNNAGMQLYNIAIDCSQF